VVGKVRLSPSVESDRGAGADLIAAIAAGAYAGGLLHALLGRWRRPTGVGYDADSGQAA
jgi:hypothetical protein